MEGLSTILGALTWLGSIMVLFRLFKMKGFLHGLLGLIIPLYPLIWGIKHWGDPEYNVKTGMILWLIIGGVATIINIIIATSA
jgi:hypothetical protein